MTSKNHSVQDESYEDRIQRLYSGAFRDRLLTTYHKLRSQQQAQTVDGEDRLCQ